MNFCQVFNLGICRACCYFASREESPLVFSNQVFHYCFTLSTTGGAKVSSIAASDPVKIDDTPCKIYDLRGLIGSKNLTVELNGDSAWIALFTNSQDDKINLEQLSEGKNTVYGEEKTQKVITVFKGLAYVNDKQVKKLHFARVPVGANVEIDVPKGTIAVVLSKDMTE